MIKILRGICKLTRFFQSEAVFFGVIVLAILDGVTWLAWSLIAFYSLTVIDALFFNKELQQEVFKQLFKEEERSVSSEIQEVIDGKKER